MNQREEVAKQILRANAGRDPVYEFEGDKIKRAVDYWDVNTLLRQLGASAPSR